MTPNRLREYAFFSSLIFFFHQYNCILLSIFMKMCLHEMVCVVVCTENYWTIITFMIFHMFNMYIINESKPLEKSDLSINFNFIIISWMRYVCTNTNTHTHIIRYSNSSICTCVHLQLEWYIQEPINNCTKTI